LSKIPSFSLPSIEVVMKYKLLVVDVDGTLVGRDGAISSKDSQALTKARQKGIAVSLSSGRATRACLGIIHQLSLDGYHIFFDGALVSNPTQDREVYAQPLSRPVVKQAIEFAHLNDIRLELYSATHYFAEQETWSTKVHREFFSIEPTIIDFTQLGDERIIKGGLVATNSKEVAQARSFCLEFSQLHCSWARSPAYPGISFINIIAPGVSKGKALTALASHLGVSLDEVMAVGDGPNDAPLLTTAGLAVAMGNATDEVKALADHTTLDIDHSGLAAAVKRFLL